MNVFKILTSKFTSKWEDNIRMDLKGIGIITKNWTQDRDYWRALINAELNLRVTQAMELVTQQRLRDSTC